MCFKKVPKSTYISRTSAAGPVEEILALHAKEVSLSESLCQPCMATNRVSSQKVNFLKISFRLPPPPPLSLSLSLSDISMKLNSTLKQVILRSMY